MVGNCVVNTQLPGEPLSKRLEAAAQNSNLVSQRLQCATQLPGTFGDGENRLELVKDICRDTLEKRNTLLKRGGEIQFAIHRALGDFLFFYG